MGRVLDTETYQIKCLRDGKTAPGAVLKAIEIINKKCKIRRVSVEALQAGSRRSYISKVRAELSLVLVDEWGLTLAETARLLGVTTSAVARAINRVKYV
jgi:hypothetical protein